MAIPKDFANKYIKNIDDDDIITLLQNFGIKKSDESFKTVQEVISDEEITAEKLLDTSKQDLLQYFSEVDDKIQKKILKMRHALRKFHFDEKNDIDIRNIKKYEWNDFAFVFEKRIKPKSNCQREEWYDYLEEETVDGETFTDEFCKKIAKDLKLNSAQKLRLKNFYDEIA